MNKSLFAAGILALASGTIAAGGYGTKIIAHGWDLLAFSPDEVLANVDKFDRTALDGITLTFPETVQADGTKIRCGSASTDPAWLRSTLEPIAETFRKITEHPSQKHDFLLTTYIPYNKRLAWTDDAAWDRLAHNLAEASWLARAGGLKGLCIDNEDYTRSRQFKRLDADPPYDEALKLARARGRQVFSAVFREYPDQTLIFFWFFSHGRNWALTDEPLVTLREENDLQLAFFNGLLDVLPPEAVVVDGDENGYRFETPRGDFLDAAVRQFSDVLVFVDPANRRKYRAQMRVGFGLYLDAFTSGKLRSGKRAGQPNPWYRGEVNGSRAEHFRQTLEGAVRAADEYIWIYGEAFSFIKWENSESRLNGLNFDKTTTWEEKLDGLDAKLRMARDPQGYFRERLAAFRADPEAVNLAKGVVPRPWQPKDGPQGTFFDEADEWVMKGVSNGCYSVILTRDMTNRNFFAVSADVKGTNTSTILRWQKDLNWNWTGGKGPRSVPLKPEGAADAEGWTRFSALVRVPEGANRFHLQLGARLAPLEEARFRNVFVWRIH